MDYTSLEIPFDFGGKSAEQIEGIVEEIVYENSSTGFFVARFRRQDTQSQITIVGKSMPITEGATLKISGVWVHHPRFGPQFQVNGMEIIQPSSLEAIEQFLASGVIPGIGRGFAQRIVKTLGADTLHVLNYSPEQLARVPGLGKKRAEKIYQVWKEKQDYLENLLSLQQYHIPLGLALKIYKRYGSHSLMRLRENPYQIASEIPGIGFKTADRIAKELGFDDTHPSRISAGIIFVLYEASDDGHVFLPKEELIKSSADMLKIDESLVEQVLESMASNNTVIVENDGVYLPSSYWVETQITTHLYRILNAGSAFPTSLSIAKLLSTFFPDLPELDDLQKRAICEVLKSKITIITGGPGTGKTTVIKGLIRYLRDYVDYICLCAPTGRASRRLESVTGYPSYTIHKLLEYNPQSGYPNRNSQHPLTCDLLIVDECSMVDQELFLHLLQAVPSPAHIVFVGDVDQLPSVGPGNVFSDLITSGVFPTIRLTKIFRQTEGSGIVHNAHRINRGMFPEFNQRDFFFIPRADSSSALQTLLHIVKERIPKRFGFDPVRDIQVLAPLRRGDAGVMHLNQQLQAVLNPDGEPIPHTPFRIGDKVMQLRNDYEKEIFNGDIGIITDFSSALGYVTVLFEPSRTVIFSVDELDQISLAYAVTVHKAQGSEYPAVVLVMLPQHYLLLQRNVLYTAITRAKQLVTIVGSPNAINKAIHSTQSIRRYSRLAERIRNVFKQGNVQ